ncbi:hypothetical protein CTI12_AA228410 [Artemisia annua]|uniref:Endonuclease/exonuclease/phosphatase domain-containing protein n=1 Tax=Artemisia annua TaxID=35608 RepID=A0A2U1NU89_ARTAN|nr:hypothetical protein CTI12_AA228410 [Artemisia annua]
MGIQESKSNEDNCRFVYSLWGNQNCCFAIKKASGNSGGIIAIWNDTMFSKHNVIEGIGFLAIVGRWTKIDIDCLMIVVYAPQDLHGKHSLWLHLTDLINNLNLPSVVLGDFNEVPYAHERKGSLFCKKGALLFNTFILDANLVDLPMGGRKFTRMNKFGNKLSKIDRILVSQDFILKWPHSNAALPRDVSDHCPLILKTHAMDYGPIPFKFF